MEGECSGGCFTESCNHCECTPEFEDANVIDKLLFSGKSDNRGQEIYEGDIITGKTHGNVLARKRRNVCE